jgi:hypothetical protein
MITNASEFGDSFYTESLRSLFHIHLQAQRIEQIIDSKLRNLDTRRSTDSPFPLRIREKEQYRVKNKNVVDV